MSLLTSFNVIIILYLFISDLEDSFGSNSIEPPIEQEIIVVNEETEVDKQSQLSDKNTGSIKDEEEDLQVGVVMSLLGVVTVKYTLYIIY